MSNLSLNIGLTVERGEEEIRFVRIKVPPVIPRLLPLGKMDRSSFWLR
jgi:polyphosphate kinase